MWSKTFGGPYEDYAKSVLQTMDGGYIIVGTTKNFGAGLDDVYVIKTDSLGNGVWTKTFGWTDFEVGNSVQQTLDGEFIIAGTTESFGAGELYLIKIDSAGSILRNKTFGIVTTPDEGYSVQQTTDGDYIIAGRGPGGGLQEMCLIKTTGRGTLDRCRSYGETMSNRLFCSANY